MTASGAERKCRHGSLPAVFRRLQRLAVDDGRRWTRLSPELFAQNHRVKPNPLPGPPTSSSTSMTTKTRLALPLLWPAPQTKPYGFTSDLVVTASDQRPDAVPTATVTMRVRLIARMRSIAPHYLHSWVCFRHRNRIGADRWQSRRRGHTDRANQDRGKNVTHLDTPFGPIGP